MSNLGFSKKRLRRCGLFFSFFVVLCLIACLTFDIEKSEPIHVAQYEAQDLIANSDYTIARHASVLQYKFTVAESIEIVEVQAVTTEAHELLLMPQKLIKYKGKSIRPPNIGGLIF